MHPILNDLVNQRPCSNRIMGIDHRVHDCPVIGDMPIFAKGSDGLEYQLLLRNVRHSPTFMDSLISINQLWRESKVDVIFKDSCCLRAPCGKQFPFGVPRATGLYVWNVVSVISKGERMAPTVSLQSHGRNYHNDPLSKPGANPLKTSDAKPRSKVLSFQATHSSKSISHIASSAPDIAAQHMHRRLHIGARRMNLLPSMTADAPSNLSRAKVGSCLLYTSPSPRDLAHSRMPSSA